MSRELNWQERTPKSGRGGNGARRVPFQLNLEERVGHLLRRAYQRHVAIFQQKMSEYKLTAAQFIVLATLLESEFCSQSDLVRLTAIDQATIRGIIDRLKVRGLVSTMVDPSDARKVTVGLTPEGEKITNDAATLIDNISEETFNGLNEAERVALMYLLRRIADMDSPAPETS